MIQTSDLTFGAASQSLILDCEDGPITSVTTVQVFEAAADDTSPEESATTGSGAIDSVSTTLGAAASAGDGTVTVASGTSIAAGRSYQIASAAGKSEMVEIAGISGVTVTLRHPLLNDYPITTSTLAATRATIAVSSTWVADLSNLSDALDPNPRYRVRWAVVVAGVAQVYDRFFDLVRYKARHGVTPLDVDRRYPQWIDRLPTDYRADQGRALIDDAYRQVRMDLWQRGKSDTAWRTTELVAELVIVRSMLALHEATIHAGGNVSPDQYKVATDNYQQRLQGFVDAPFARTTSTGGGAAVANKPAPLWRR